MNRRFDSWLYAACFVAGSWGVLSLAGNLAWAAKASDPPIESSKYETGGTDAEIIAYINAEIARGWKDSSLTPSTKAPDNEWCRRVYIDIIGRIPSISELQAFLKSPGKEKEKKAALLDKLLDSDKYSKEYARNWTTIWTNLLIGRPPARPDRRDPTSREGLQQYLRQTFYQNTPYNTLVKELVSAEGTTAPGSPKYNGATNFLVNKLKENGAEATARTARYFLGLQVQCTQCHNHPFNDAKQDQYWGLNAFFRQTQVGTKREGRQIEYATLRNDDFRGEATDGKDPTHAEIYYELRNGQMQVAYPTFIDGTTINPNGTVEVVNRRKELAELIVHSDYFGKALVNRYWGHFLGYGFTKPVDDIGPHNSPSHADLFERLGKEFSKHNHDLRRLIRWICLSDAYGLSSKTNPGNKKDDPTIGEKPKFTHFYLRQMQAEELYESLLVIREEGKDREKWTAATFADDEEKKANSLRQFNITFGTDDGDEATTFNGSIPQALMMMNGEMMKATLDLKTGSVGKLVMASRSPPEAIDLLFEAALSRKPQGGELNNAMILVGSRRGNAAMTGYQDVLWALLNCNEFILVH